MEPKSEKNPRQLYESVYRETNRSKIKANANKRYALQQAKLGKKVRKKGEVKIKPKIIIVEEEPEVVKVKINYNQRLDSLFERLNELNPLSNEFRDTYNEINNVNIRLR